MSSRLLTLLASSGVSGTAAFSPLALNPTLRYSSDQGVYADAGVTPIADGGSVEQWNDLSANGYNASQASAGLRPLYTANALNGYPILTFDGVDDALVTSAFVFNQPRVVYMVVDLIDTSVSNGSLLDGTAPNSARVFMSGTQIYLYAGAFLAGPSVTVNQFYTIKVVFNGASSSISVNGGAAVTGDAGAATATGLAIGGSYSGQQAHCAFADGTALNRLTTAAEDAQVFAYLQARYKHY